MKFYKNLFTSATKLGLAMLVVVGNIQSGFTSSSLEGQRSGWSGGGSTVPPPKPGECPPSDPQMHCYEQKNLCNLDCECPQKQKCCFQQDCGYSCSEPTIIIEYVGTCNSTIAATKPGICPKPLDTLDCKQCYDQCKSDCECPGKEICCPQPGCGNWCRDSIIPTTA